MVIIFHHVISTRSTKICVGCCVVDIVIMAGVTVVGARVVGTLVVGTNDTHNMT